MQINSLQRWCAYRVLARVPLKVLDDDTRRSLFNKAKKKCQKQGLWAKMACHTICDWSEHLVRGGTEYRDNLWPSAIYKARDEHYYVKKRREEEMNSRWSRAGPGRPATRWAEALTDTREWRFL